MTTRRQVLATVCALAVSVNVPIAVRGQPSALTRRIGFISPGGTAAVESFRASLADLGYVDGRDINIDIRAANGQLDRLPELAAELVGLKVEVIAVVGAVTARAVQKATTTIPIVFAIVVDPVADRVVASMDRPGGNTSGVTSFDPQQAKMQISLLKEAVPSLERIAILWDLGVSELLTHGNEEAARSLGLRPQSFGVKGPIPDIGGAFAAMLNEHVGAVLVLEEPITVVHRKRIAELANAHRLPSMFARDWVDAGGLMAYGTSVVEAVRRMAGFVDRILKGASVGDLPVETVTRQELVLNVKTAREIDLTFPPDLLKRANTIVR
ncbi:MAG TPA: ABC transporter substrate-binding protein [Paraburkholderia sp.]